MMKLQTWYWIVLSYSLRCTESFKTHEADEQSIGPLHLVPEEHLNTATANANASDGQEEKLEEEMLTADKEIPATEHFDFIVPGALRKVKLIGTSQCTSWATGDHFPPSLRKHLGKDQFSLSMECAAGRYILQRAWAKSALSVALQDCQGPSPADVIVLFVGGGEIFEDHGRVPEGSLKAEPKKFVTMLQSMCSHMPKLVLFTPPVLAESPRVASRYDALRAGMNQASVGASGIAVTDMGPAAAIDGNNFCRSGNCDRLHFCRVFPFKHCPLIDEISFRIASAAKNLVRGNDHMALPVWKLDRAEKEDAEAEKKIDEKAEKEDAEAEKKIDEKAEKEAEKRVDEKQTV